jgi:hypothetical protein
MSPDEANVRAERAKQLLNDEVLMEAFNATHEALISALNIAKTPEEAFKATVALQAYNLIKNCIQSHIETAKVIEFNTKRSFVDKVLGR